MTYEPTDPLIIPIIIIKHHATPERYCKEQRHKDLTKYPKLMHLYTNNKYKKLYAMQS